MSMDTHGFVGGKPINMTTGKTSRGASSARSRPAAPGPNESLAGYMTAGVESWSFDPRVVVGCLLSQDAPHQKRIAQIVFHLIRSWSDMAGIGFGPEHPMHPEWTMARAMMANLSNAEFPA